MERIFELKATNQKSYYNKAFVIEKGNNIKQLKSYQTIVCEYNTDTGEFTRLWAGYSPTTGNHIKDFIKLYNINFDFNKKNWESLPTRNN